MRLREQHLAERLQDEAFRAAYYELEPEFQIAQILLKYRSDNNLTQAELSSLIDINRSDLSKLESAEANPTLKTLKKIASALGSSLRLSIESSSITNDAFIVDANIINLEQETVQNDSDIKQ